MKEQFTAEELHELEYCINFMIVTSKNRLRHFEMNTDYKKNEKGILKKRESILEKVRKM